MKCSGSTLCAFSILLEIFIILNIPLFLHPLLFWHKFYALELHVKPPADMLRFTQHLQTCLEVPSTFRHATMTRFILSFSLIFIHGPRATHFHEDRPHVPENYPH